MASSRSRSPKPLRSSSTQAAGRVRAGRGPRVAGKPQVEPGKAAQETPRLVPPLPPRGPGVREGRGFPDPRKAAHVPAPHAAPQARSSEARAKLPAAAGRGRVHRDAGGGREGWARAGRGGSELDGGGANGLWSQPPAGRHVGRCGGRSASRAGAPTGRRRCCPARALGPPGAPTLWACTPSLYWLTS